jgi:hypothetical protein
MRPNAEYRATAVIHSPTGVRAYNPGDDVDASVVENWGLVVGQQVLPANVNVIPRPAGNAKRAEWEAYWLGQGIGQEEIDGMTRDQMAAREPVFEVAEPVDQPDGVQLVANPEGDTVAEQATAQTNVPEPPGSDAKKADWVAYAVARGMNEQTAQDSTIAQLQAFDYDHL